MIFICKMLLMSQHLYRSFPSHLESGKCIKNRIQQKKETTLKASFKLAYSLKLFEMTVLQTYQWAKAKLKSFLKMASKKQNSLLHKDEKHK